MECFDASSGYPYFFDTGTGESTWELAPASVAVPGQAIPETGGTVPTGQIRACRECNRTIAARKCWTCAGALYCTACYGTTHALDGPNAGHEFSLVRALEGVTPDTPVEEAFKAMMAAAMAKVQAQAAAQQQQQQLLAQQQQQLAQQQAAAAAAAATVSPPRSMASAEPRGSAGRMTDSASRRSVRFEEGGAPTSAAAAASAAAMVAAGFAVAAGGGGGGGMPAPAPATATSVYGMGAPSSSTMNAATMAKVNAALAAAGPGNVPGGGAGAASANRGLRGQSVAPESQLSATGRVDVASLIPSNVSVEGGAGSEIVPGSSTNLWHAFFDKNYRLPYYFNPARNETTWTLPPGATVVPLSTLSAQSLAATTRRTLNEISLAGGDGRTPAARALGKK